MNEYIVKIKTLTPIWTGDENRENTTLRETGIIGSLRWWYEALIRGLGGNACDPTDKDSRCTLSGKEKSEKERISKMCPACYLFGCTGWARKFRLEVNFNTTIPEIWIGTRKIKGKYKYLKRKVAGMMADGTINLKFTPLREISKDEWVLLNTIFNIISKYGALGAHTSQGNGVIEIVENNLPYRDEKYRDEKISQKFNNKKNINDNLPNLKEFSFYKFRLEFSKDILELIKKEVFWTHQPDHTNFEDNWDNWEVLWNDYHFLPIAFHIRDFLRALVDDREKRHKVFGELGKGSKVFVSHGYKINENTVEVRIFGYQINEIESLIKNDLKDKLKVKLFSESNKYLQSCTLSEEKTGNQLLEEVKRK